MSMSPDFFDLGDTEFTPIATPRSADEVWLDVDFGAGDQTAAAVNPLDITDEEGDEAKRSVRNVTTSQIGRAAWGLGAAVETAKNNGLIDKKRRFPWRR